MMISSIKAKELIDMSDLKGGVDAKSLKLASASKSVRQSLIRRNRKSDEGKIAAVIEIQRVYRGYCTRCRLLNTLDPTISKTAVYSTSKHDRLKDVRTPTPEVRSPTKSMKSEDKAPSSSSRMSGRERLDHYYQSYVNRMFNAGHRADSPTIISFEEFCANYIQNWWSQMQKRRKSAMGSTPSIKSGAITYSGYKRKPKMPPKKKREGPLKNDEAATIIQRAWRKHIDVQVYRYYRDLINFKQRGDPMMMLKCINPQEAKLLDAASGTHIKFRLAGDRFPPNIYYKIYTHRPIQDLCANSPKDYTKPDAKRKMARDVHNKGNRVPTYGKDGWYDRHENNGWRLVSDRLIHHISSDPITWETSNKKVDFHHNKLQRRVDVEKKKKNKKIQWMKNMYTQGMLKAKVDDKETVDLIEGAAAGMVATIDSHGPEAIQDWEVDELLDWTTSLNFEDYVTGWKEIATSSKSEKSAEDRLGLFATAADPFQFAIGTKKEYDASTRPSHNTPVSSRSAASMRQPLAF